MKKSGRVVIGPVNLVPNGGNLFRLYVRSGQGGFTGAGQPGYPYHGMPAVSADPIEQPCSVENGVKAGRRYFRYSILILSQTENNDSWQMNGR
jgi:hypothetical protein